MNDRELDAMVAEKVMGWTSERVKRVMAECSEIEERNNRIREAGVIHAYGIEHPYEMIPHYSTNLAEAWRVVERTRLLVGRSLSQCALTGTWWIIGRDVDATQCQTASHAICLAALQAVGVRLENS